MNDSIKPKARNRELIIQELANELLIYDLTAHKAYCLNQTAMIVWNGCDGKTAPADLAARLAKASNTSPLNIASNVEIVRLALAELDACRLLETPVETAASEPKISRRQLTRQLGLAAAASLPVIIALRAPAAAQSSSQQAAALSPDGTRCNLSSECASGCCDPVAGVCASADVCDTGARPQRAAPARLR